MALRAAARGKGFFRHAGISGQNKRAGFYRKRIALMARAPSPALPPLTSLKTQRDVTPVLVCASRNEGVDGLPCSGTMCCSISVAGLEYQPRSIRISSLVCFRLSSLAHHRLLHRHATRNTVHYIQNCARSENLRAIQRLQQRHIEGDSTKGAGAFHHRFQFAGG